MFLTQTWGQDHFSSLPPLFTTAYSFPSLFPSLSILPSSLTRPPILFSLCIAIHSRALTATQANATDQHPWIRVICHVLNPDIPLERLKTRLGFNVETAFNDLLNHLEKLEPWYLGEKWWTISSNRCVSLPKRIPGCTVFSEPDVCRWL